MRSKLKHLEILPPPQSNFWIKLKKNAVQNSRELYTLPFLSPVLLMLLFSGCVAELNYSFVCAFRLKKRKFFFPSTYIIRKCRGGEGGGGGGGREGGGGGSGETSHWQHLHPPTLFFPIFAFLIPTFLLMSSSDSFSS